MNLAHEYVALLRKNPDYRNLWLARVVSNLGDWFNLLASAALITSLTGAGTAISYLFLARFLPVFLMSPFAGVLADRYERRAIMVATDLLRGLTVLGFLLVREPGDIWLLYVLTVVQFVLSSLYTPAHSALLSNIVPPADLVTANALDGFTWSTMLALGALLGGMAAALFGVTTAFIIDAATFVLSAWFVTRIGAVAVPGGGGRTAGMMDFVDGLAYLRRRPFILGLSLVKAGGALVWGVVNVMEIPLATQVFPFNGNGTITLGIVYACVGLGTGLGPLLVRRWLGDGRNGLLWAITASFFVMSCGVLGLGFAPSLGWMTAATLVRSLGSGSLWVFSSAILQHIVANEFRGRVFAFEFAALTLTQSLATLWAGLALDQWQLAVQDVLIAASVASFVVSLLWAWFQARQPAQVAVV
ncbi:MAG TPA: MFS transporter [Caldilineaceae bacterium]|nr:MFS transporter [Caldilineaceae bacterium]